MKQFFFFFSMLASIAASAKVTVTPLSADYINNKVTFKVEWNSTPYNNRAWVWVDFCPVTGTIPDNSFSTATISNAVKTAGNGTVTYSATNTRGFFIEYASATNAGTTVTATLSNAPAGKFNWCAYGSDYPPNVTLDKGTYTFKGTTNFLVSSHAQPLTSKTIAKTSLTVNSSSTFTDATGYPGIGSLYCPYTGSDLYMDATHLCRQRTSGAQNWEAWIKDTRDNELYRIVLMPDGNWWLAQNVKYASTGYTITEVSGCTKDKCGRWYTGAQSSGSWGGTSGYGENKQGICPSNWKLPVANTYSTLFSAISGTASIVAQRLRAKNSGCSGGNDYYGWASDVFFHTRDNPKWGNGDTHSTNNGDWACGAGVDYCGDGCQACGNIYTGGQCVNLGRAGTVRCFR